MGKRYGGPTVSTTCGPADGKWVYTERGIDERVSEILRVLADGGCAEVVGTVGVEGWIHVAAMTPDVSVKGSPRAVTLGS